MAFIELRLGDNDKKSVWGGRTLPNPPASSVTQLQTALRAVGTYPGKIDGDFGRKTEFAIKIFQWCLKNSDKALKKSALITHVPNPAIVPSGKYDLTSHAMLTDWVANAFAVTGDLVRVNADNLSNIELGPGFKPVKTAFVTKSEFLISKDAYPMIKAMNAHAKALKLIIKVNQAFRIHGVKVSGAVVTPAAKSQHLIGHAIDCNIVDGASWNTSSDFKRKKQTSNAVAFIKAMKKDGYRWGGDFPKVDTPHFDKQVSANSVDYDVKCFINQKQIASGEYIAKQIITK